MELPAEGYTLSITEDEVRLEAPATAGIFYGVQSLLQYLPGIRTNERLELPVMEIIDEPAFGWRGMMLDVSRHFFQRRLSKKY